jgi:hypothetical protein
MFRNSPERSANDASRFELTTAVRRVDARIARMAVHARDFDRVPARARTAAGAAGSATSTFDPALTTAMTDELDPSAAAAALRTRSARILECIDSLENAEVEEWRAALPGLRSAVADLEYRTDLAELAALDSVALLDAHVDAWLRDMAQQIETMAKDVGEAGYDRGLLKDARVEHGRLVERFTALRAGGADNDGALRRSLAQELTELRRTVRALVRSAHQRPPGEPV